jgi:hypothetical protein
MLKLNLTLIFGLLCLLSAGQQNNFFCGFDQEQSAIYHNDSLRQVRDERAVEISLRAREFRAYRRKKFSTTILSNIGLYRLPLADCGHRAACVLRPLKETTNPR